MKSYTDFSLEEYLKESLAFHIKIDFHYDNEYFGIMEFRIMESYDMLKNIIDIPLIIYNEIYDIKEDSENIEIDLHNDFPKRIVIDELKIISSKNSYCSYNDCDVVTKTIHIDIVINWNLLTSDEFSKLVIHEIMHGYEDYNRKLNNKDSIFSKLDTKYRRSLKLLGKIDNKLPEFVYFFNDQEQNAYFSELYIDIKNIIDRDNINIKNIDFSHIVNEISKLDRWKQYVMLIKLYEDDSLYDKNLSSYKFLNGFKSNKKEFKHYVKKQIRKFKNKFEQQVPKMIYDIICDQELTHKKLNKMF